jgi:cobalt ECF transporter T component CbiQ
VTATATPDWLTRPELGLCPCGCIGRRRKGSFVEKTMTGAAGVLRAAMLSDDTATGPGLLQRVDARVKVLALLASLVTAGLVHHVAVLAAMYVVTLALAVASRLSLSFFVKRVWLFVPIFTGVVVLPATLNLVTPGHVVVPLGTWFGQPVGVTAQGLTSAGLIVTRVATSISLVVLVTLTTSWSRLLAALRALFVPRVFVAVLGMSYRYLFHLLDAVTDMYTARKARTVTRDRDVASSRRYVAASAGALFGKAQALSEEVHFAMLARGYTGDARTISNTRLRVRDMVFALAVLAALIVTIGGDRVLVR